MFSPLSVGLASSRVPLPLTPNSTWMPSSPACLDCTSRTIRSVSRSGVPGGSLTVISKRSWASCGIRSVPSIGTIASATANTAAAIPSTSPGRCIARGSTRR